MDFPMRTGNDMVVSRNDSSDAHVENFMSKVDIILQMLTEESLSTARKFANCCDRNHIAGRDVVYALKYQTREFLNNTSIDAYFTQSEQNDTDSDTSSDCDEEDNSNQKILQQEANREVYSDLFVQGDEEFYKLVKKYDYEWDSWHPEDPVYVILKNAVDKAASHIDMDE